MMADEVTPVEPAAEPATELNTSTALGVSAQDADGADNAAKDAMDAGKDPAKDADTEGKDGKPKEPEGAPDEYAEFKMPEGMEIDQKSVERFAPLLKDLNLSQEQAQTLVDAQAEAVADAAKAQIERWTEVRTEWLDTAKADEEIGGDKFDGSLADATAALKEYGTPELLSAMDDLGIGNHPEIIRFIARVGKDLGEDTVRGGNKSPAGDKTVAQLMYPTMKS
jgi:hypothetical protein